MGTEMKKESSEMTTKEIKELISNGKLDTVFLEVYYSKELIEAQRKRYADALDAFEQLYGEKNVKIYSAPGRTEIGGNHTDHQNGKVLAGSINLDAIAVAAMQDENVIRLKSEGYPPITIHLNDLVAKSEEKGTTEALIRGVANDFVKRGYKIGGFEAYVTSDVLRGSGLSSSAAFEVLIGNIFSGLYNEEAVDAVTIAKIGQEAERNYFGKPCGLMDQMACSVGGMIFIDFANVGQPEVKKLHAQFQPFGHALCIVDTKGSHADLTDEYAAVPQEMKEVAAYFGKELLCQVDKQSFLGEIANVREKTGDRAVLRAMHWFEENVRVEKQVEALESGNFEEFKAMIGESGASSFKYLQNVFSVKNVKEQSVSLALALSESILKKTGISRVHGGGFAGTIQAFVPVEMVEEYKNGMESVFGSGACYVLQIRNDGGRKIVG